MSERLVTSFQLPSTAGNDRVAADRVAAAVADLVAAPRLEKLRTAVAEAALNAIEHGNRFDAAVPIALRVTVTDDTALCVTVSDAGLGRSQPVETPDLGRKLRGEQSPRGWGLFLIRNMVDDCSDEVDARGHRVHLRLKLAN